MKKLLLAALILSISSPCFAVPLGGKGSDRKESIKGSMEVIGTFSVIGKTVFNGKDYTWPKTKDIVAEGSVLKNDGKGGLIWDKEVSPSGDDGSIQINEKGAFSSDKDLVWNSKEKNVFVGGAPVSLLGHTHAMADLKGILPVASGGTGTDDGSIKATGELVLSAGGENKNVTISPSGSGSVILSGSGTVSSGPVRSENGFNIKGTDGTDGTYTVVSDIKLENNSLKRKIRQVTVSGGIVTAISAESDWMDAGSIVLPTSAPQPAQQ